MYFLVENSCFFISIDFLGLHLVGWGVLRNIGKEPGYPDWYTAGDDVNTWTG